jgi:hypothetical protein
MGATLRYLKIIDADAYQRQGGEPRPGLEQLVRLPSQPPATAAPFVVLRRWVDISDGGEQETWRIESREGERVYTGVPTTLTLEPEVSLASEVPDAQFAYTDDGYQLIVELDGREVARDDFPVVVDESGGNLSP